MHYARLDPAIVRRHIKAMADKSPLIANECGVLKSQDGRSFKIVFQNDDDESAEIIVMAEALPQIISVMQGQLPAGTGKVVEREGLRIGETFRTCGFKAKHLPDGSCDLTISLDLMDQGRVVTLPILLSPKDLESLFSMIVKSGSPDPAKN